MAQQQQQSGSSDNSMAPVWIMILLFVTAFLLWKVGHQYIVSAIFAINMLQAKAVHFFLGGEHLVNEMYLMQTLDPSSVDWSQLMFLSKNVGNFTRYPIIIVFLLFVLLLYKSNVVMKYRKTHNMKTLQQQEQNNWTAIMPVVNVDLVSEDINKGPWAMALTPMEFARKYKLLRKEDKLLDNPLPGMEMTASIRKGDAKRVFTLQLGPYWDGFEYAPPQARALAAVFLARINRDRNAATTILETLNRTYAQGKIDYSVADATLRKYKNEANIQEIIGKHAYLLTVLASLLENARLDGVVPSSEFLWLKPTDRRLWYMLNCVGRQTPFAEVAGPFAHWKAEKAMGRRSLVPMIDEAIKALEIAIKEVKLSPKELQELKP